MSELTYPYSMSIKAIHVSWPRQEQTYKLTIGPQKSQYTCNVRVRGLDVGSGRNKNLHWWTWLPGKSIHLGYQEQSTGSYYHFPAWAFPSTTGKPASPQIHQTYTHHGSFEGQCRECVPWHSTRTFQWILRLKIVCKVSITLEYSVRRNENLLSVTNVNVNIQKGRHLAATYNQNRPINTNETTHQGLQWPQVLRKTRKIKHGLPKCTSE